jgi:hypothetical protein
MNRAEFCVFSFNMPLFYQLNQRILQTERALFPGDRDFLVEVLKGILTDVLPSAVTHHE